MKTRGKSLISLLLTLTMIVSVFTAAMVSVNATHFDLASISEEFVDMIDTKKEPKDMEKIIIDFRSEGAFAKTGGSYYQHKPTDAEPDPLTGGKYSWDSKNQAMKLEYSESKGQKPYRIMFRVNNARGLSADYNEIAIVYRVVSDKSYTVRLSNSPNQGKALTYNSTDSTSPVGTLNKQRKELINDGWNILFGTIDTKDANGKCILDRWVAGNMNTLSFDIDDKNAEIYIKEVVFFKDFVDSTVYHNLVDLSKDPTEYMSDAEKATFVTTTAPSAPSTPSAPPKAEELPLEEQPDPVFMKFTGPGGLHTSKTKLLNNLENGEHGSYSFKTVDGTQAMKLNYLPFGSFPSYRCMPYFTEKDIITNQHRYVRITYNTSAPIGSQIVLINNKNRADKAVLVSNTSASGGEWVVSNAVDIGFGELLERFVNLQHCTLGYTSTNENSEIYIKEIGFFASPEQAYAYYGDEPTEADSGYTVMSFVGFDVTGKINTSNSAFGNAQINEQDGTLDIGYTAVTNQSAVKYMAKILFTSNRLVLPTERFARVLYMAEMPEGTSPAVMRLINDKTGAADILVPEVKDTNGEFVLTATTEINEDSMQRFAGSGSYTNTAHNSLTVSSTEENCLYKIKAIYFFPTKEEADSFALPSLSSHKLTINGNDISKYQIVVSATDATPITDAASKLAHYIKELTGIEVPVVTDKTPASEYEILIGQSERELSKTLLKSYNDGKDAYKRYAANLEGNTLVITSNLPYATEDAVDILLLSFLYSGLSEIPELIELDSSCKFDGKSNTLGNYTSWAPITNVADPEVYTDNFDTDGKYFTEDNNAQIFNIANGTMSGKATDEAMTYIHVFEGNASIAAKLTYTGAAADSDFGLMLRYTGKDAFVKAGYDFTKGAWYILSREGADFYGNYSYSAPFAISENTAYNAELTADGSTAVLKINGTEVLRTNGITQVTPGKIGVYAKNTTLTVDDVKVVLLSGMGTIIKDVYHTLLPGDTYREGGSVFEMNDGTLNYTYRPNTDFKSVDGGKSWERTDKWTDYSGYVNILRLVNGDFMKITNDDGWMRSYTSSDDGKTWIAGGAICQTPFKGDKVINAFAGNMNDKINQSASGRIFYSQNYETTSSSFEGRKVFCEFYFSDDNGTTWIKSETDSWTISGNESETYFGECKLLECADGTIRMYNSWNQYGCIVYSDSTDGGKTFGPLTVMKEFKCGRSSMQFYRDPYGETDTTYYMIWVNTQDNPLEDTMPRSSISLAKSTDGKTWTFLGDVWRWQSGYRYGTSGALLNHVVDPFVKTTADSVIVGTGLSEHMAMSGDNASHGAQRQHIWTFSKEALGEGTPIVTADCLGVFTDVYKGDSYADAVKFVVEKGLFNGTSKTTFAPATTMTRSMFVTVLGRLDGADMSAYKTPTFKDVVAGQWYTSYVEWAAANNVVNGIGNGLYGINGEVTVEQICLMLSRYNGAKSAATASGKVVSDFSDSASISSWAADGVKWAVENGVYAGQDGKLNPTAPASRALVATIFHNYVNVYGK